PPTLHHLSLSHPLTTTAASTLLSTYISLSESHPHLHPDALLTPTGPTFSSHGGPMGGVVMHNLRRVAAGLRGEVLEVEVEVEGGEGGEGLGEGVGHVEVAERVVGGAVGGTGKKDVKGLKDVEEGWQAMSEYEREEGAIEVGEIGDRDHFVGAGGEEPVVEVHGEDGESKKRKGEGLDKEARKKAKKERNKEFKRKKAGK
ncbi:hypothetical protein GQ43DRAFT_340335, partial [Delitschia confertaspora ATCC 74209]